MIFYIILENYKTNLDEEIVIFIENISRNSESSYIILNKLRMKHKKNNSIDLNLYEDFISHIDSSKENN